MPKTIARRSSIVSSSGANTIMSSQRTCEYSAHSCRDDWTAVCRYVAAWGHVAITSRFVLQVFYIIIPLEINLCFLISSGIAHSSVIFRSQSLFSFSSGIAHSSVGRGVLLSWFVSHLGASHDQPTIAHLSHVAEASVKPTILSGPGPMVMCYNTYHITHNTPY